MRLIPQLPETAQPADLIREIRATDPTRLALHMLDSGETPPHVLQVFEQRLKGQPTRSTEEKALRTMPAQWARRCRRVLAEPAAVSAELSGMLEAYYSIAFEALLGQVTRANEEAARAASGILSALPTPQAIERLSGGYTLAEDLDLQRIILAPSTFIYPFVVSRVDEAAREALMIYGVRTDMLLEYEPVPIDATLLRALRVLSDPDRLKVLKLIGRASSAPAPA